MTPTEVLPADPVAQRALAEQDRLVANVERRASIIQRIRAAAIGTTAPEDWLVMGDACHLRESGAAKIARVFGITTSAPEVTTEPLEEGPMGPGYMVTVRMTFSIGDESITEIGAATSRDEFFSKTGRGDNAVWKPSYEVDRANVTKKASTNCFARGVTRLTAVRGLTPDQLRSFGLDVSRLRGIKYDSASRGGRGQQDSANVSAADLEAAKAKRADIRNAVLEMAEGDVDGAKVMLQALTAFTGRDKKPVPGVASVDLLNPPRLDIALEKVKKEYEEWLKSHTEAAV